MNDSVNVILQSDEILVGHSALCHFDEYHSAECHCKNCHSANYHFAFYMLYVSWLRVNQMDVVALLLNVIALLKRNLHYKSLEASGSHHNLPGFIINTISTFPAKVTYYFSTISCIQVFKV